MLKISVTTYVMEVSVVSHRGLALASLQVHQSLGSMLCLALNRWLHWPYIGLVNLLLLVLVSIAFFFFPESPAYLLMQRKEETAHSALQKLRSRGTNVEEELQWIKLFDTTRNNSGFLSLMKAPFRHHMLTLIALSLVSVFSGSAMITYSTNNMLLTSTPIMSRHMAMAAMVVALTVGKLALIYFADRMGRRFCLLLSLIILVLAYSVISAMDYASALRLKVDPLNITKEATDNLQVIPNR